MGDWEGSARALLFRIKTRREQVEILKQELEAAKSELQTALQEHDERWGKRLWISGKWYEIRRTAGKTLMLVHIPNYSPPSKRIHMSDDSDVVKIKGVRAPAQTDKALRCVFPDGRDIWVPQSQIHDDSEVYIKGHSGVLVITGWYARKEGIVGE